MIDAEKLAQVKTGAVMGDALDPLLTLSEEELRTLRADIDKILPPVSMDDLNLGQELADQYTKTKRLMDDILSDEGTPANQKAQVANSVVSTLAQLVKLQEDLRREETLKIMEACLVESVKVLPDETKAMFFAEYERLAVKAGLQ